MDKVYIVTLFVGGPSLKRYFRSEESAKDFFDKTIKRYVDEEYAIVQSMGKGSVHIHERGTQRVYTLVITSENLED